MTALWVQIATRAARGGGKPCILFVARRRVRCFAVKPTAEASRLPQAAFVLSSWGENDRQDGLAGTISAC
jgi:hypothetical protein